ncbi:alanine-glyoxylate transaminase [Glaciecola punicea ACAM 611]|jgi:alanine-glyoxylate transaminase/serine-glyoxylate transaminase/serine-pyruvate transaminase|uniref:Alanine-glyoxylate transaminase n=1 Tax=Glaciecola punicea ACAM 611 TaxID=1121923 RepID=H5TBN7_9ALTE|nr:L-aspartate--glyoxylate aminotransferase BhcA [Glaciecola punicea]OFA30924.1 serine--glyoxylate aminotransferase [Glaciecola punicea]GAB55714.1 alanine-glyoxylate transaminase [Glaciecola punicea ACAM 611]
MRDLNPVFIPGPTNMPDRLRAAMNIQTIDHRSPDFAESLQPMLEDLKKVFKTQHGQVFIFPGSGTGGWEASITNTLSPGDKVLVACYGMFSHRWIDMCQRHGLDVEVIECEWGTGAPADLFAQRLATDAQHSIKAVLVTHNETATGVLSDIAAVRLAMDKSAHPAMLYVDCVSSLGSMDFQMDAWGVDLAVSGSQKGFMLATGLAIVAASPKALAALEGARCTRCYFDFRDMGNTNKNGAYPYTPPIQLINGLKASLEMLFKEGLDNVFDRHFRLAEGVRKAVAAWGLRLCAQTPELYSHSVSAIYVPEGFNSNELTDHAYHKYGVSFGVGLGEMAGKAFRIGHLGALTDVLVLSGIATIEMAMKDLDYPIELGVGVAAAQEYLRSTSTAKA